VGFTAQGPIYATKRKLSVIFILTSQKLFKIMSIKDEKKLRPNPSEELLEAVRDLNIDRVDQLLGEGYNPKVDDKLGQLDIGNEIFNGDIVII